MHAPGLKIPEYQTHRMFCLYCKLPHIAYTILQHVASTIHSFMGKRNSRKTGTVTGMKMAKIN